MSTLTLSSLKLASLLSDTVTAAGKDGTLPALVGVQLYTVIDDRGDTLLVGNACDRYIAIQASVRVDAGDLDAPIWLTREQVDQVLTITRPYRSGRHADHGQVVLEVEGNVVTLRQIGLNALAAIEAKFEMAKGQLPDMAQIFTETRGRETSSEAVGIDGAKLIRLARLANDSDRRMVIRNTGKHQPVEISIGKSLLAIIMPIRLGDEQLLPGPIYPVPVMDQKAEEVAA